jgi:hypothetical protein
MAILTTIGIFEFCGARRGFVQVSYFGSINDTEGQVMLAGGCGETGKTDDWL